MLRIGNQFKTISNKLKLQNNINNFLTIKNNYNNNNIEQQQHYNTNIIGIKKYGTTTNSLNKNLGLSEKSNEFNSEFKKDFLRLINQQQEENQQVEEIEEDNREKSQEEIEKEDEEFFKELMETKEKLKQLESTFVDDIAKLKKARIVADQYLKDGETLMEQDVDWGSVKHSINDKEKELRKLETLLEFEAIEDAVNRYRELIADSNGKSFLSGFKSVRDVMMQWNEGITEKITKDLNTKDQTEPWVIISKTVSIQKAVLKALNIVITKCVLNSFLDFSVDSLREQIGVSVFAEYKASIMKKHNPGLYKKISKLVPSTAIKKFYSHTPEDSDVLTLPPNPREIKAIGEFFTDSIFKYCKIQEKIGEDGSQEVPAFSIDTYYHSGIRSYKIVPHPNIFKLINDGHSVRETGGARLFPMVIKPLPWVSPIEGPYLHYKVPIMRTNGSKMQLQSLIEADMSLVFRALNALGETPWSINKNIFSVISEAWESGGDIGDIPKRVDHEYPEVPDDIIFNLDSRRQYHRKESRIKYLNYNLHSLRCDTIYKLEVAKKFLNHTLYFPHNIDFRGRSYPIPPHLNHLGSDFCRSLLKFEKSLPLGENGFRWLKVHLANLYGVDKIPFEERVAFTERNIEAIMDSADRPLNGNKWWLNADYPWQALAACMELTNAIRSGNPTEFLSNLPIHQDGTCNGLQHYAALGGDEWGATKVNLLPSDRPQDVYSGVAQMVAELVEKDAKEGSEMAKFFTGRVDRKLVKQTVMTSVYGVTYVGAREQISNAIIEKLKVTGEHYEDDFIFDASSYIARHTFSSLNNMFEGARSIMRWMSDCASLIAKSGECVSWVTPLGLPVVQPYKKGGKYNIKTLESDFIIVFDDDKLSVDTLRQRSAFPPNFIHSLDSTHMFLTALACEEQNITYSSVHDSYWTHASTVDKMNNILRNEFVELHKQPILDRLMEWFQTKHPNINFPPIPKKGNLDINKVRDSKYFFH